MKFNTIKERCLQILYPRVCPVCGELLKLPHKWYRTFDPESHSIFPAGAFPSSGNKNRSLDFYRSCMICRDCYPLLKTIPEPRCVKCSRPLSFEDDYLCDLCRKKTRGFDTGSALLLHDDVSKKIIYDLKFHNRKDNADLLALEMAFQFHELLLLWKPEVLLPVPLHKKRFRERGFNQAELLAQKFSFWVKKLYGLPLPVDSGFLIRHKNTLPQRTLESNMRESNVGRAFSVIPPSDSPRPYHSVILMDDIFTSGATIDACAKVLKENGVSNVYFLTASIV